jgi:tetraacyldisaccharide 4'-kinase
MQRAIRRDLDLIVTTEKDSVRFPYQFAGADVPIYFLRVEIEILGGQDSWEGFVQRLCKPQPIVAPGRFFA